MAKPSYGVVVGKFQVNDLHDGHRDLFDQVSSRHNRVIVFVGRDPSGISVEHPLDFAVREKMIKASYPDFLVEALPDCRDDEEWSRALDNKIAAIADYAQVTLYGGRDSFVPKYKGKHKPVELALDHRKHKISGTDIRREFADKVIEASHFRCGMIYSAANMWPVMMPCVDIAALYWSGDELELLLGRREDEDGWRFPGGHAEFSSSSYEEDAQNELFQETHVSIPAKELRYVGSMNVNDWRTRSAPDRKIRTTLFRGFATSLSASPGDDLSGEVKWFKLSQVTPGMLVEEHRPLLEMLIANLRKEGVIHARIATA
jgi:bifunctional NMN adenylyltransferase/nudix hydrolase